MEGEDEYDRFRLIIGWTRWPDEPICPFKIRFSITH